MTQTADRVSPLLRRLGEMVDGGRLAGARALLAAVKSQNGASADAADVEARLLMREGRNADALSLLDAALASAPASACLLARRAEARMQGSDPWGAAADAADAVIIDPACAVTKALLGVSLIEVGRYADAVACLSEAVRQQPTHAAFRSALSTALERGGDSDAAAATLADGIRHVPADTALRTAAIMVEMRRRNFPAAAALGEAARNDGVVDACTFGLLGHALSSLGEHARATEMYCEALKLGPEDPYVRHLVTASGVLPEASRAPSEYLETVFDGYAARFEAHLISLGYRVPGLIRAALLRHLPELQTRGTQALLDLGCGTGLIGVVLSDITIGQLTGVDLSARMLDEAAGKRIYGDLVHAEIEAYLAGTDALWPVVIAADVFCYFGALGKALRLIRDRLEPGGVLVFSVESLQDAAPTESWRLGRLGRYAHTANYLRDVAVASGLEILAVQEDVLRFEGEAPVDGFIVVLRRPYHA